MKLYLMLKILLAVHIAGIVLMAGTTLVDFITVRTFWKLADGGGTKYRSLIPLMAQYGMMIRVGAITIFATGITMLSIENGAWLNQLWFKIKMVLVFLIIINGLFIGNTQGHKLRQAATTITDGFVNNTVGIRENLGWFYPIQLTLFFLVILLSTIRFDK